MYSIGMYVCMYVCIYLSICIYIYIYIYIYIDIDKIMTILVIEMTIMIPLNYLQKSSAMTLL